MADAARCVRLRTDASGVITLALPRLHSTTTYTVARCGDVAGDAAGGVCERDHRGLACLPSGVLAHIISFAEQCDYATQKRVSVHFQRASECQNALPRTMNLYTYNFPQDAPTPVCIPSRRSCAIRTLTLVGWRVTLDKLRAFPNLTSLTCSRCVFNDRVISDDWCQPPLLSMLELRRDVSAQPTLRSTLRHLYLDDSHTYHCNSADLLALLQPLLLETLTTRHVSQTDVVAALTRAQRDSHTTHLRKLSIMTDRRDPVDCSCLFRFSSLRSLCVQSVAVTGLAAGAPFANMHLHTLDLYDARDCQHDQVDEVYAADLFVPRTPIVLSLRILTLTVRNVNAKPYLLALAYIAALESLTLSCPSICDPAMTVSCQRLLFTTLSRMPTLKTLDADFKFSRVDETESDPVTEEPKTYEHHTPLHFLGLQSLTALDVFSANMFLAPLPLSLQTFKGRASGFSLRQMSPPPALAKFLQSAPALDYAHMPLFEL